jgi:ABC-type lipoprotein export system ATPase subunit
MDKNAPAFNFEYSATTPVIEANGISKVYKIGRQMVSPISDISLTIAYGDFVVIFGPSGAGKSTLMNVLMGVEPPDTGEVLLKGESLFQYSSEVRTFIRLKRFGYIPQQHYWLDRLSILDNVALPLIMQGAGWKEARKKAQELLRNIGMEEQQAHKPLELSGGQQQKASVVRALINDPWLIFADEPTEHLDTQSVEDVIQLLLKENKENQRTVVMVTHDLQFLKYATKWLFVRDGRLWDIDHQHSPFKSIKEAVEFIDSNPGEVRQ